MTVAKRLCDAGHYAAPSIHLQAGKLDKDWQTFVAALEDRSTVLTLSVIFQKKAEEVGLGYLNYFFADFKNVIKKVCYCFNETG